MRMRGRRRWQIRMVVRVINDMIITSNYQPPSLLTCNVLSSSSTLFLSNILSSPVANRIIYFFSPNPAEYPRPLYPAVGTNSTKSATKDFETTTPRSSPRSASTLTKSPGRILRGADGLSRKLRCARLKCTYSCISICFDLIINKIRSYYSLLSLYFKYVYIVRLRKIIIMKEFLYLHFITW